MINQRKIINGRLIAKVGLNGLKPKIAALKKQGVFLKLGVVLVGESRESAIYIEKKKLACKKLGINFALKIFPVTITTAKLCREIINWQKNKLSGIIVQLPLPRKINKEKVLQAIRPELDVDCLTMNNLKKLSIGKAIFYPPAVAAILEIAKKEKINWQANKITVVGYGELVGKPLSYVLKKKKASFTVINKLSKNIKKNIRNADILITAVGIPGLIKISDIKKGAVVIDVATVWKDNKLQGDVEWKKAIEKVKKITPVPGGVGPITVYELLKNIVIASEMAYLKQKKLYHN